MQPLYTTENRFEAIKKTLTFYGKGLDFHLKMEIKK
jgi:hypothetical protein